MTLGIGRRLGPYEIVALLGEGGMGQVWRARHSGLKRDDALKVVPDGLASSPDRLARFTREAQVLASLNHPNIAHVYGLEQADGRTALVMELVEGPTLADRIAQGPMSVDATLAIARQIAGALDAAHERGIVHRDLKPANVKVRADGTVKLLDFGLAKASSSGAEADALSTLTLQNLTSTGVIVGTPAYMSPEQARGLPVDKRTDIWSFGCVVYEMLTGRPAFGGATVTDTLAAIVEREPDWTAVPSQTPPVLVQLMRRCTAKDVGRRLRDIGDARHDLELADPRDVRREPSQARPAWQRGWAVAAGSVVLVAASVAATLLLRDATPSGIAPPGSALPKRTIVRATADEGVTADPALSRDGAMLAYASDRAGKNNLDIWVQQTAGSTPLQLTRDLVDELEPAFSPDGSQIAYRSERERGGIHIVPALGGQEPRLLVAGGRRPRYSPDGRFIAYWTGTEVGFADSALSYRTFVIPVTGGTAREVEGFTGARYPVWAPDSQSLLLLGSRDERPLAETYDWWRAPLNGGAPVAVGAKAVLMRAGIAFDLGNVRADAWREDQVLFSNNEYLWSMRLDPGATAAPTDVERLTFGTNREFQGAIAESGLIAFASASVSNIIWSLPIDPMRGVVTGDARRVTDGGGLNGRPSPALDGERVAYRSQTPRPSILIRDLTTGTVIDIGVAGSGFGPAMSPNGSWVAFEDGGGVAMVPAHGGTPRRLCEGCLIGAWTADSQAIVTIIEGNNAGRLTWIAVSDGATRNLIVSPDETVNRPFPSPGGRLLAFRRANSTGQAVMVAPLTSETPVPRPAWIEIAGGETDARPSGWSPDGALLYFVSSRDGARCLWAQRVNRETGVPVGSPFIVKHFHGGRNVYEQAQNVISTGPGNAIAGRAFFYDLSDLAANIWMMRPASR